MISTANLYKENTEIDIQLLNPHFKRRGIDYSLVKRTPHKSLYIRQRKNKSYVSYLVLKSKVILYRENLRSFYERKNKPFKENDFSEYKELFPLDNEFGKIAWEFNAYDKAEIKYNSID